MSGDMDKPISFRGQMIYEILDEIPSPEEKCMTGSTGIVGITTGSAGNVGREIGLSW